MNIAIFHNLPSGGAKRALYEHARGLQARGHTLDAYVMEPEDKHFLPITPFCRNTYEYASDVPVNHDRKWQSRFLYHPLMRSLWIATSPARYREALANAELRRELSVLDALESTHERIARDINSRGYDLVYVHHCIRLLSPFLLRFLTIPSVFFCQDTYRPQYEWTPPSAEVPDYDSISEKDGIRKRRGQVFTQQQDLLLEERAGRNLTNARSATMVLANSWYSREAIIRAYGINARLCYLGVDTDFFRPSATASTENIVLSVGSFTPIKCHEFVIDAIARIPQEVRPSLRIIGYDPTQPKFGDNLIGSYAQKLITQASAANVELILTMDTSEEALREAYQTAGVVAFAPYLEPFGFVSLEAMACGKAVVGVSEGGVRETVQPGVTGFLTERNEGEFAEALMKVLSNPRLNTELGKNGREAVCKAWSWSQSWNRLEGLLKLMGTDT